jgi:dipeptidase E
MSKNLIIASTSTLHEGDYLEYLLPELEIHFENCKTILFIPFARPSGITHEEYTAKVVLAFAKIGKEVKGIQEFDDYSTAIKNAEGIFTGGGNTFLLVTQLYKNNIMSVLAEAVKKGIPYLGTSAGSNICGLSMQTTNDMPIVYPPSFKTLGLVPFNLNPHYLDADLQSKHMGETRETRIQEFHSFNTIPVLGLREGSWLEVKGDKIILKGNLAARLFRQNQIPEEMNSGSDLSWLK